MTPDQTDQKIKEQIDQAARIRQSLAKLEPIIVCSQPGRETVAVLPKFMRENKRIAINANEQC